MIEIKQLLKSKTVWISIFLILLGISMPAWLGLDVVGLTDLIDELREDHSGNTLMLSAFALVLLNTIRAIPHWIGAFILGDELGNHFNKPWLKIVIPVLTIPSVYFIINLFSPFTYHFGGPAISLLIFILLLQTFGKGRIRRITKSFVLVQLLFGLQWLNAVPFLTQFGFGHGPISMEIKNMALEINFEETLNLYSVLLCLIFVINAIVLAVYLIVSEQKWLIRQELNRAKLDAVQSRSGREALHLVHDLKTPLASIEGFNSLIKIKTADPKLKEYTEYIENSISSLSDMVSEILYEDQKKWCTLERLINYVRANKLVDSKVVWDFQLEADGKTEIYINKIRFTRAIVNLIDNAYDAVKEKEDGKILIRTSLHEGYVFIEIKDNGVGISKRGIEKIWEPGYSTKESSGIGLTFVRNVVAAHNAQLNVRSEKGIGTTFLIKIKGNLR